MMMNFVYWFLAAAIAGALGGAATGVKIGGRAMGNDLAAMMGGFFGISAVAPAAILVLLFNLFR
jgi:hypothetical protein